jgi:Fic family protein
MNSFREHFIRNLEIPLGTSWLLGSCMEARGKQDLWLKTKPETIEALRELAIIQSTESSNRIEGVTVDKDRLLPLLASKVKPQDRSEEEVFGYRKALDWIHEKYNEIEVDEQTLCNLHRLAQSGSSADAGSWKKKNNEIIEVLPDGSRSVRFVPLDPAETPKAIKQLCLSYQDITQNQLLPDLLSAASFVFDFLCIHPFRDGNGRVSRLITLLLLYKHNYFVGRYISLERIVENTKTEYYQALQQSSLGWHSSEHTLVPFWNYFLSITKEAYGELSERVSIQDDYMGGKSELIRQKALSQIGPFTLSDLKAEVKSVSSQLIKKILSQLKDEGHLELQGKGRGAFWKVVRDG